ncbi:uncharacterized protein LOC117220178 isoform X1 [Megalopta genalis]|uniref:uncharacterized protein LOC117220178 isoform X1 n=1 Tax=Megalopta genalis TaxID=115081 RepID=UPI003FD4B4F6
MDSCPEGANSSTSTSCTSMTPPPAKWKREHCKVQFQDEWLQEPEFKVWLEKCANTRKAKCALCKKVLSAHRGNLLRHRNSERHCRYEEITKHLISTEGYNVDGGYKNKKVLARIAEMRLCMNIIEHNRSFNSFNHFIDMLYACFPDSEILTEVSLRRTKIYAIITNVLNQAIIEKHIEILVNKFFSTLVDESTDVSNDKNLCILVRYVDEGAIVTYLLDYIKISKSNAENLYKCFIYALQKNNLDIANLVGVCIDNANVMLEKHNSFVSRILAKNSEVVIVPCTCHCMHLIAYSATKCLPTEIVSVIYKIYNYFSRSPKRQNMWNETFKIFNIGERKIIQPSPTRWLMLRKSINIILMQFPALVQFFLDAFVTDNTESVTYIFKILNNRLTKVYLEFLKYILGVMNKYNLLFQSNDVMIHLLSHKLNKFLKFLGSSFLTYECINTAQHLHAIDIYDNKNLMPVEEILLHADAEAAMEEVKSTNDVSDDDMKQFYQNIQKFYQTAYEAATARLPFDEEFLNALDFLNPTITLDIRMHKDQLNHILQKFPSKFDNHNVHLEWREIAVYFEPNETIEIAKLNICDFWKKISQIKNPLGQCRFPNIMKVVQLCLALPHSNAEVERFFSMISKIKTDKRNKLRCKTISSLTRLKLDLKSTKKTCANWQPSKRALQLCNDDDMYKKETIPQHLTGIILPDEEETESDTDTDRNNSETHITNHIFTLQKEITKN